MSDLLSDAAQTAQESRELHERAVYLARAREAELDEEVDQARRRESDLRRERRGWKDFAENLEVFLGLRKPKRKRKTEELGPEDTEGTEEDEERDC